MGVSVSTTLGQRDAAPPRYRHHRRACQPESADLPVAALHATQSCDPALHGTTMRDAPRFCTEAQCRARAARLRSPVSASPSEFPGLALPRVLSDTASQDLDAHIAKLTAVTCNRAASPMGVNVVARTPPTAEPAFQRVLSKSSSNASVSPNPLPAVSAQLSQRTNDASSGTPALVVMDMRRSSGKAGDVGDTAKTPVRCFTSVKEVTGSSGTPTSGWKMSPHSDWLTRSASLEEGGGASALHARTSPKVTLVSSNMLAHIGSVRILYRCWGEVSAQHDEFVAELCEVLTRQHPEFLKMFETDSLLDETRIMVDTVGKALLLLPKPGELIQIITDVGVLHRRYRVQEAYYAAVRDAFMSILPNYLPADLQDTYAAAWEPHWRAVIELITHGSTSSREDWHAEDQRTTQLLEARRVLGHALTQLQLSARAAFVQQIVDGAIERDASMTRVAMLRERRVSIAVFHGLVRFLRACGDTVSAGALMDELVPVYYPMGLDVAALRAFRQPFIDTCEAVALRARGLDQWGPSMPQSLGVLWDSLTQTWEQALMRAEEVRITQADRAPDGSQPFCLMFTDIEGSTRLWERNRAMMTEALVAYHRATRGIISDCGAYEVKAVGDSFVIATKDVLIALKVALAIQLKLMKLPIANGFEMVPNPQGGGPADCWRADSLRVRIGIHLCRDASAVYDSVQRRYDYYGPSVNCAAHTAAAACGGQILMTQDALEALQGMPEFNVGHPKRKVSTYTPDAGADPRFFAAMQEVVFGSRPMAELVTVRDWGQYKFKGTHQVMKLFSVLPKELSERVFVPAAVLPARSKRPASSPVSPAAPPPPLCAPTSDSCDESKWDMMVML